MLSAAFFLLTPSVCSDTSSTCVKELFWRCTQLPDGQFWGGLETQDATHRTQCEQEPTPGSARRRLETEWQSWCTGGRFESQNSQFFFSNGNTLSSPHIRLSERRKTERERETRGGQRNSRGNSQGEKHPISTSNLVKTVLEMVFGHQRC